MEIALPFFFTLFAAFLIGCLSIYFYRRASRRRAIKPTRFVLLGDRLYAEQWNESLTPVDPASLDARTRDEYRSIAYRQWREERDHCGNPERGIGNDWLRTAF